jgi:hypothetical protein
VTQQHSALDTRDHLLAIAASWSELEGRLSPSGSGASEVHTPAGPGVPIDAHVSDVIAETTEWVNFLARVLVEESDWEVPEVITIPILLRSIARERLGHFTEHKDELMQLAFHDEAERHRKRVEATCRPVGVRTIRLGIACIEVRCDGQYAMRVNPTRQDVLDVMVCTRQRHHVLDPDVWTTALRRNRGDRDAARGEILQTAAKGLTTAV